MQTYCTDKLLLYMHNNTERTTMWANAQRDGRSAEYRWRPLFNVAKFGWCPLLECCAVMLPRRKTRWDLLECPKLTNQCQPLVGRSWPYCEDMRRRYCCLTIFFFQLLICALVAKIQPDKVVWWCPDGNFWPFFASCIFSKPRAAYFRPAF